MYDIIKEYKKEVLNKNLIKEINCTYIKGDIITLTYRFDVEYDFELIIHSKDGIEMNLDVYLNSDNDYLRSKFVLIDSLYVSDSTMFFEIFDNIKSEIEKIIIDDKEYFLYLDIKESCLEFSDETDEWNYEHSIDIQ